MVSKIVFVVFHIFLSLQFQLGSSTAESWIRVSYYRPSNLKFTVSDINSALFTHLICCHAWFNSATYQVFLKPSEEEDFSIFADTVKRKNPSVVTLLSIFTGYEDSNPTFSSMTSDPDYRKSFINSSIKMARRYGFQGLDLRLFPEGTSYDTFNFGILLKELRAATESEAKNSGQSQLILTVQAKYFPEISDVSYPIKEMQQYLDWVHVQHPPVTNPGYTDHTEAPFPLYHPENFNNIDSGIKAWIDIGLSADKLVLELHFTGDAWTLANSKESGLGAPSTGPAINEDGIMNYKEIKNYIRENGPDVQVMYNATYVVNYCTIGSILIIFDDVEAIKTKVSYAKEKKLLGYHVWEASYDDNWELSRAAAEVVTNNSSAVQDHNKSGQAVPDHKTNGQAVQDSNKKGQNKRSLLGIVMSAASAAVLLVGIIILVLCYCWRRKVKLREIDLAAQSKDGVNNGATGDINGSDPNLIEYTLTDIEEATDRFSIENKLGEGGYGPVYKGILPDGRMIAAKKLAKTSSQGFEEFKNEVILAAKLQHVNLVRVLGFCIDNEERILIYEYMPNKSLDSYLFDPIRRYVLDWKKRVHIIEGVTQGLLYLQEYSRLIIIHRDLKVSNILLDGQMKPKISDFGIARIFEKNDLEANTQRIVGTFGYAPPEYVQRGIYSTKSDVYSFGVLLLQIISGKRVSCLYGVNQSLNLVQYAYELWKDGKGMEFMDETLDDTHSSCKLLKCLQIALLCVQEFSNDRPSMLEVFSMLKNETTDMLTPKKPGFPKQNDECAPNTSSQHLESGSVSSINEVTTSEVLPR